MPIILRKCMVPVILGGALLVSGCAGPMVMMTPRPPDSYEVLGCAKGRASGSILLGPSAYNFVPIMLGSRGERAYNRAVQSVPGATSLINVSIQESWCWYLLGTARTFTVEGDAIRSTN
jgi:hypothetical protein